MALSSPSLESAELWTSIVTGSITGAILLLGGALAFWRFVLQQRFGNNSRVDVTACSLRQVGGQPAYVLTLTVENQSAAAHKIREWWRKIVFPDEVGPDYDPNSPLDIFTERAALDHYHAKSQVESGPYLLAPGEKYCDQMIQYHDGPVQEVCYVEYTLGYRKWKWVPLPWPVPESVSQEAEFISQKMISAVQRADLAAVRTQRRKPAGALESLE